LYTSGADEHISALSSRLSAKPGSKSTRRSTTWSMMTGRPGTPRCKRTGIVRKVHGAVGVDVIDDREGDGDGIGEDVIGNVSHIGTDSADA